MQGGLVDDLDKLLSSVERRWHSGPPTLFAEEFDLKIGPGQLQYYPILVSLSDGL